LIQGVELQASADRRSRCSRPLFDEREKVVILYADWLEGQNVVSAGPRALG